MIKVIFSADRCKGCELCTTVCPVNIVIMSDVLNSRGFRVAALSDEEKCTGCFRCARICPDMAIEVERQE